MQGCKESVSIVLKATAKLLNMPQEYKGITYTDDQIKLMRDWVNDCQWREDADNDFIDELTDLEILKGVNRHYEGGLTSFILDIT